MRNPRRRLRALLLALIGLLYVVSIPWYRTPGAESARILGLPDWVLVALACYAACALLNAGAWLLTEVPDAEPGSAGGGGESGRKGRGGDASP